MGMTQPAARPNQTRAPASNNLAGEFDIASEGPNRTTRGNIMRMSVGVGPFRFYGGRSKKSTPLPPAFGQIVFILAVIGAPIWAIYAWVTKGFGSAVATFFFALVVGLIVLAKTANNPK